MNTSSNAAVFSFEISALATTNLLAEDRLQYKYPALKTSRHIRLVTISPRAADNYTNGPVSIQLQQFPIDKCPPYQALSYTWGQTHRPDRVLCGTSEYISVTPNLFAALVHLQGKKPVTLWIDAICINQKMPDERSSQVQLMGHIYEKAKRVIVWLYSPEPIPPGDNKPWVVVQKPEAEDYHATEDNEGVKIPKAKKDNKVVELPFHALKMFQHPWFMRIWILQEIAYARYIVIRTENQTVYWEDAQQWARSYLDRVSDDRNTVVEERVQMSIRMMSVMDEWRSQTRGRLFDLRLPEILDRTQHCGATEPKDKVFALLSLVSDVDETFFDIDYTWSEAKICTELTLHVMQQGDNYDILRCVGNRSRSAISDTMPSWAPDLFGDIQCSPLPSHNEWCVGSSDPPRECGLAVYPDCDDTTVTVRCLRILDVKQVELAQIKGNQTPTLRTVLDVIEQWYKAVLHHPEYKTKDSRHRINAFWGTIRMTMGSKAMETRIDKAYSAGEGWHWHFRKLYNQDIGDTQPEDAYDLKNELDDSCIFNAKNPVLYSPWAREVMFRRTNMRPLIGRAFGFTSNGRMALWPSDAQEGDHVCLLYSVQVPFVLRKVNAETYRVIGPCYVHQHFDWDEFESPRSVEQLPWITLK